MTTIEFGQENNRWIEYGIQQHNIIHNGQKTKYHTIERNKKIVSIGTKQYSILPNEEALKIANIATENLGLKPFTPNQPYKQKFELLQPHAIIDKDTRLNAFYAKQIDEIQSEKVIVGLRIFNSIDRSTAFGARAFTFRVTCQNQVIATLKKLSTTIPTKTSMEYIYQKHTGQAFTEKFFSTIRQRMEHVTNHFDNIITSYKKMATENATKELIEKLSNSNLPIKIRPDYIPKKPNSILEPPKLTQWEIYNDITANIWHNTKTTLQSKEANYNILHQIMPLQVI